VTGEASVPVVAPAACPKRDACELCGDPGGPREVLLADTPLGQICLTVCDRCLVLDREPPPMGTFRALRRVMAHTHHTDDCDYDD
jgi:hypothetical protein